VGIGVGATACGEGDETAFSFLGLAKVHELRVNAAKIGSDLNVVMTQKPYPL